MWPQGAYIWANDILMPYREAHKLDVDAFMPISRTRNRRFRALRSRIMSPVPSVAKINEKTG